MSSSWGDNYEPRTGLRLCEMPKVPRHRLTVMRDQHSALAGCPGEDLGIGAANYVTFASALKIDHRLAAA